MSSPKIRQREGAMRLDEVPYPPRTATVALVRLSSSLLLQALGFPIETETELLDVRPTNVEGELALKIKHPDLPMVEEGRVLMAITPTFARGEDGQVALVSWNAT